MVVNETIVNISSGLVSEAVKGVFPLLLDQLAPLMGIFKAISIAVLVWLVFMIVRSILRIKNYKRMARMEDKLDLIISLLEKKKTSQKDKPSGHKN